MRSLKGGEPPWSDTQQVNQNRQTNYSNRYPASQNKTNTREKLIIVQGSQILNAADVHTQHRNLASSRIAPTEQGDSARASMKFAEQQQAHHLSSRRQLLCEALPAAQFTTQ